MPRLLICAWKSTQLVSRERQDVAATADWSWWWWASIPDLSSSSSGFPQCLLWRRLPQFVQHSCGFIYTQTQLAGVPPETDIMEQGGKGSWIKKDDIEHVYHPSSKSISVMRVEPGLMEAFSLKMLLGTGQDCIIGSCFLSWWKFWQFYSVID